MMGLSETKFKEKLWAGKIFVLYLTKTVTTIGKTENFGIYLSYHLTINYDYCVHAGNLWL